MNLKLHMQRQCQSLGGGNGLHVSKILEGRNVQNCVRWGLELHRGSIGLYSPSSVAEPSS